MKKIVLSVLIASTMLSACATSDQESAGGILGGIAGGFLGSQFGEGSGKTVVAIAGAMIGAWAGKQIVRGMTRSDQIVYEAAAQEAATAPLGEPIEWNNPETGNGGTIVASREGTNRSGEYCREYQQTITIDGRTERAYGTACRQPDGSWRIVN